MERKTNKTIFMKFTFEEELQIAGAYSFDEPQR